MNAQGIIHANNMAKPVNPPIAIMINGRTRMLKNVISPKTINCMSSLMSISLSKCTVAQVEPEVKRK